MGHHLVLVGGGHAHMTVMRQLDKITRRGHRVTLVSPDPYHYYSGMGPGMLGGLYRPPQARFHVAKMVEDRKGSYCHGSVVRVDAEAKRLELADGSSLDYDVASFNVGSMVAQPAEFATDDKLIPVKPVVNLAAARQQLIAAKGREALKIVVVGGGPAGVEVAGNAARLLQQLGQPGEVVLLAGSQLLPGFPARAQNLVRDNFARRRIVVREGARATAIAGGVVTLGKGQEECADLVFLATGVQPPKLFQESALPVGPSGGLLVNRFLQVESHPALFGGGDCIDFAHKPLARVGVYAVRQNPVLFNNLRTALEERPLKPFIPQSGVMLILNLGDDRGVLHRRGRVANGAWSFRFKDWIDRRFMRRFQVSGELS